MISEFNVKKILSEKLQFDKQKIKKLDDFAENLLIFNKKHNLISKNTEKSIWDRHILDSAQLVKFINPNTCNSIADLGTGGGFPGVILAIFFNNFNFHVKLYEKSPLKCFFLNEIVNIIKINAIIINNDINNEKIDSNYVVCRAFKKLPQILNISREKCIKRHKLILMRGRSAQQELKKAFKEQNYKYRLEKSITDSESKIVIIDVKRK